jgi:hypothetical protein
MNYCASPLNPLSKGEGVIGEKLDTKNFTQRLPSPFFNERGWGEVYQIKSYICEGTNKEFFSNNN